MSEKILLNIEKATIKQVFDRACKVNSKNELICSALKHPTDNKNCYTFEKVKNLSRLNSLHLLEKGLMIGDRVSIIIGNIPEFFIIKLALNCIGVSCVPINAELSINEISYLIRHSNSRLIITNKKYFNYLKKIEIIIKKKIGLALYSNNFLEFLINIKPKHKIKLKKKIVSSTEASLLYTSGTTGKPKGRILSHAYEINAGINYINKNGYISLKKNKERIYNCLPVHHVNSGILSFYAAILSGNCQIQSSKFSANSFWKEIKYSKATIFHYLGVMVSILIKKKHTKYERDNSLRLGVGAGIPPNLHKNFETRFKVPMIELWGMTEMVRCIFDNNKDREVGSRCIGRPKDIIETKVIDTKGKEIINQPGQLLIRYSKKNPKKYFFSGYYKDSKATAYAWRKNWFHTGDIVLKKNNGKLYFIDRNKNIIRRGGENISATEVETILLLDKSVKNCAVISYPHKIYEEEVLSFIILNDKVLPNLDTAKVLLNNASKELAYFKLPGFIKFCNKLPLTSTQKIEKTKLLKSIINKNNDFLFDLSSYKKKMKFPN